jgi:hypothetical protein
VEGYGSIEPGILPASDEVWIDQGGELWANVSGQALNVGENIYIFAPGEGVIRVSQGAIFNVTDAQGSLGGIVQCDGTFNYTGGSTLTFAEIFGNGVINTNVNCTESLSPGDPAGTLSITGNLQQSANSAFKLFLAGATGGLDNGVLAVSGSAALSGTLDVSLVNGFVPSIGEQFTILTAGLGVTGAFTELQSAAYSSGSGYSTYGVIFDNNFNYTVEYNNNDVVLTITAVPEPGGISGIVLGGLGLLRRRRRRRGLL